MTFMVAWHEPRGVTDLADGLLDLGKPLDGNGQLLIDTVAFANHLAEQLDRKLSARHPARSVRRR